MAEEREVIARLKTERTGDEGAFTEAAEEIRELDGAAGDSTGGLDSLVESESAAAEAAGSLKDGIAGAGEAAAGAAGPIEGMGDAAAGAGQKALTSREQLEQMFLKVATALPMMAEAERALKDVEDSLNSISKAAGGTGKEFDGLGSKFGAFTASVTQFLSKVGNIDDAFAAFANTNGTLVARLDAAKEALDGLSPAAQKFKDSITGTDEKLMAEAAAITRVIEQMENAGDVHDKEAGRIGTALADMAKKAEKSGVDLGKTFDDMVKKYPELTEESKKHAKTLDDEGSAAADSAETQKAAFDTVAESAGALSDKVDDLGKSNSEASEKIGDSASAFDTLTESFDTLKEGAGEVGDAIKDAAAGAGEGSEDLADVGEAGTTAGEGLTAAKDGAAGLGEAAENSKTGVANLATELGSLPDSASGIQTALEGLNGIVFDGLMAAVREIRAELQGAAADAAQLKAAIADADGGGEAA